MAVRIKKNCITRATFLDRSKNPLGEVEVIKGKRLTFWIDQSKSQGFEVLLEKDRIQVRGIGAVGLGALVVEPHVSNVVDIKLRRSD